MICVLISKCSGSERLKVPKAQCGCSARSTVRNNSEVNLAVRKEFSVIIRVWLMEA